jgi:hypothetical protein
VVNDVIAAAYVVVIIECLFIAWRFWRVEDGRARVALIGVFLILALYMALLLTSYLLRALGACEMTLERVRIATRWLTTALAAGLGGLIGAMLYDGRNG